MIRNNRPRRAYFVSLLTVGAVIIGWGLVVGNVRLPDFFITVHSLLLRPVGSAQLVSYDPLPAGAMDDECDGQPVNVSSALAADPIEEADVSGKKPVRIIRDRYPSYSSVTVDSTNDEVVLTDENLFNILAYNRLDNTSSARITEPKRSIGGLKTKIEFQSGV
jgi:hypothetical protein